MAQNDVQYLKFHKRSNMGDTPSAAVLVTKLVTNGSVDSKRTADTHKIMQNSPTMNRLT